MKQERWITIGEYVERFRPPNLVWLVFSFGICITLGCAVPVSCWQHRLLDVFMGIAFGAVLWAMGEVEFAAHTGEMADLVVNGHRESVTHPNCWKHLPSGQVRTVKLKGGKVIGMYRPPWRQMGVAFAWNESPYDILPPKPPQPRSGHPYANLWGHKN